MTNDTAACPSCGTPSTGKFCRHCGTSLAPLACGRCGAVATAGAAFCSRCGGSLGGYAQRPAERVRWFALGAVLGMLVVGLLVGLMGRERSAPSPPVAGNAPLADPEARPPDLSAMSPRERFDRLYNRIMRAAESGDEATVTGFTPMALMAYTQLDSIDADARYHAALIKLHTGDIPGANALADTILILTPGHLFGYVIQGTVARFQGDQPALRRSYADFLKHYDAELRLQRPEYADHSRALDEFRKAALEGER